MVKTEVEEMPLLSQLATLATCIHVCHDTAIFHSSLTRKRSLQQICKVIYISVYEFFSGICLLNSFSFVFDTHTQLSSVTIKNYYPILGLCIVDVT